LTRPLTFPRCRLAQSNLFSERRLGGITSTVKYAPEAKRFALVAEILGSNAVNSRGLPNVPCGGEEWAKCAGG